MHHSGKLDPAAMASDAMTVVSPANVDLLVRKLSIFVACTQSEKCEYIKPNTTDTKTADAWNTPSEKMRLARDCCTCLLQIFDQGYCEIYNLCACFLFPLRHCQEG
jgi:hypothetical protein